MAFDVEHFRYNKEMTPTAALQTKSNHKREMVQQNQRQINQPDEAL
jgi:hypothetical protein